MAHLFWRLDTSIGSARKGRCTEFGAFHMYGNQAMVTRRDREEQRSGPRGERLHEGEPAEHRGVAEAFGGAQQAAQERSISLGDVDAGVLHQPGGEEFAEAAAGEAGGGEGRAARAIWQEDAEGVAGSPIDCPEKPVSAPGEGRRDGQSWRGSE